MKDEKRTRLRKPYLKPVKLEVTVPEYRLEVVDAEVQDISNEGACIITERASEPGNFIRLRVSPHPKLAKVRWVSRIEGKYRMGLQFLM